MVLRHGEKILPVQPPVLERRVLRDLRRESVYRRQERVLPHAEALAGRRCPHRGDRDAVPRLQRRRGAAESDIQSLPRHGRVQTVFRIRAPHPHLRSVDPVVVERARRRGGAGGADGKDVQALVQPGIRRGRGMVEPRRRDGVRRGKRIPRRAFQERHDPEKSVGSSRQAGQQRVAHRGDGSDKRRRQGVFPGILRRLYRRGRRRLRGEAFQKGKHRLLSRHGRSDGTEDRPSRRGKPGKRNTVKKGTEAANVPLR